MINSIHEIVCVHSDVRSTNNGERDSESESNGEVNVCAV
jgi:hypothetical protein